MSKTLSKLLSSTCCRAVYCKQEVG